jgi:hypothetical protein
MLGLALGMPARATTLTFPVAVPPECSVLAEREGFPQVLENKAQALRAKYRLARLKDSDPLVHGCRQAVERARNAMQGEVQSAEQH